MIGKEVYNKEFGIEGVIVWEFFKKFGKVVVKFYSIILKNQLVITIEKDKLVKGNVWDIGSGYRDNINELISMNLMYETEVQFNTKMQEDILNKIRNQFEILEINKNAEIEVTCRNIEKNLSLHFNHSFHVKEESGPDLNYLVIEWDNTQKEIRNFDVSLSVDKFREPVRERGGLLYKYFQKLFGSYLLILIRPYTTELKEVK